MNAQVIELMRDALKERRRSIRVTAQYAEAQVDDHIGEPVDVRSTFAALESPIAKQQAARAFLRSLARCGVALRKVDDEHVTGEVVGTPDDVAELL